MSFIDLESTPIKSIRARRRRSSAGVVIIADNYHHSIDATIDAVWCACDGVRTVREIAENISSDLAMPPGLALAAVIGAILFLGSLHLISWTLPGHPTQ